jgi:hypothetical protein
MKNQGVLVLQLPPPITIIGICGGLAPDWKGQLHQTRTLGAHLLESTLHHLLAA